MFLLAQPKLGSGAPDMQTKHTFVKIINFTSRPTIRANLWFSFLSTADVKMICCKSNVWNLAASIQMPSVQSHVTIQVPTPERFKHRWITSSHLLCQVLVLILPFNDCVWMTAVVCRSICCPAVSQQPWVSDSNLTLQIRRDRRPSWRCGRLNRPDTFHSTENKERYTEAPLDKLNVLGCSHSKLTAVSY